MNRRDPAARPRRAAALGLLAALVAGALGCNGPQVRSQSEEESERERYAVRAVGDLCTFGNATPVRIGGVGLVEGLHGTGGPAPPGGHRDRLEHDLRKDRVKNVKEILSSTNYALVLVSATVPPGARKGDRLDVEITLPPGSKATSLRGGRLRRCLLYNFDFAGNLSANHVGSGRALLGHPISIAEGPLLVGFGGGDEAARVRQGRIWGGAVCRIDRPFHILLNPKRQTGWIAKLVADRINQTFHGPDVAGPGAEVAHASNSKVVHLSLPPQYKHNPQRFLRVIRMVPLESGDPATAADGEKRVPYRTRLGKDLLSPAHAVVAALRLEALGTDSVPTLKRGLESEYPLVRFCAAEALAYLGSASCGEELARAVREQPYLRTYALTALASLDEAVSHVKLKELLQSDLDDETRYGAFRALRSLDDRDPAVRGELLNDSFWLHQVAPGTAPLAHVSLTRRAEVVLFGDPPALRPPFSIVAGEFAVTAGEGDQGCTVSHYPLHGGDGGPSRTRCPLDLVAIMKLMASQGATYAEVVELLRQAEATRCLTCRLRHEALPQAVTVEALARAGKRSAEKGATTEGERLAEVQIIKPGAELGPTPALFETGLAGRRPPRLDDDARALRRERKGTAEKATAERR